MSINYFGNVQLVKREYSRVMEPICSRWSLTRSEIDILLFIFNNPERNRAVDIVTYRGLAKSHVSLSVGTLEEKGLLQRYSSPLDRRTVLLALTDVGKEIAAQAHHAQLQFLKLLYSGITEDEMNTWKTIAQKIEYNIQHLDFL